MKLYLSFIAAVFISIQSILFASVEISNPRTIMDESIIKKSNQRPDFCARLSPDGKYLLFPQQVDAIEETYKLYLQNIETADEIEIPIVLPRGYQTVFTRYNFFNNKGDKLVLFEMNGEQNLREQEIVIFDIPSKTPNITGIKGQSVMAQFDYTGKNIVTSMNNSIVSIASLDALKNSKRIMSGWVHSCSPKTPYAAIFVPPSSPIIPESHPVSIEELRNLINERQKAEFVLLNLETNESFILPTYSDNSQLDDITSHWSLDGSFLFYFDVKANEEGKQEQIARIWDVTSNTEKAIIPNVRCLGPGPAENLMIMVSTEDNISGSNLRLYDIKTGELTSFGEGEIKGIHAWKNRIAYVKTENGAGIIYVADLNEIENVN